MIRYGVTIPLGGLPLAAHRRLVESLPDRGFGDVWTAEGGGPDAITPLAAAAAWQPGVRLGSAVIPVGTRGPGVLAQTAATLAGLSREPVLLGIGSSVPAHVTALNGVPFGSPLARVRDTLRFLRSALDGEVVDAEYDTFAVHGFHLGALPYPRPKVLVGALRPRMTRLAFTEGDGAVFNLLTADDLPTVLAGTGPRRAGQEVVVKLFVCPTPDAEAARRAGRRFLGWILNQEPYRRFHEWLGRGAELAASAERYARGDASGAALAVPDAVVDALWLHGEPERIREQVARFRLPGVTAIQFYLATPVRDPEQAGALLEKVLPV